MCWTAILGLGNQQNGGNRVRTLYTLCDPNYSQYMHVYGNITLMLSIPGHSGRTILVMRWLVFVCLFACATQSLADNVTIVGVNIIDVVSGEVATDQVVDIVDGRIERIIPSDEFSGQAPSKIVAAEGKFLIPGLWDAHVHVFGRSPEFTLPLFVAYGVTHVRDLGSTMKDVNKGVALIEGGSLVTAPKVITTGPLLDSARQSWYGDLQLVVKSANDVENELQALNTDQLKVYTNLEPQAYTAIVEWGARNGQPVVGHVPIKVGLSGVIGQRTIEHLDVVTMLSCAPKEGDWFARSLNAKFREGYAAYFTLMTQYWGALDWSSCDSALRKFAAAGGYLTPTLVMETADASLVAEEAPKYIEAEGRTWCTSQLEKIGAVPSATRQGAYDSLRQVFNRVRASGVPILAGTDTPNNCLVAGMSLSWELRRLVEFGMTPLEAIQAATIQPASAFEVQIPAITAGRVADFVMLKGNPLDDINAVADPIGVYTGGAWLDRSILIDIRARSQPAGLADLRWKHGVILIFAREPYLSNALSNLDELKAEIEERDIAWFVLGDNKLHTNYDGRLEKVKGVRALY